MTADKSIHVISATVASTGEIIEYKIDTKEQLSDAFKDVEARLEAYRQLKNIMLNTSMQIIMRKDKDESKDN